MSAYGVRRYEDADWPAVLELMRLSLGWRDGDPNEALFQWKHRDNPFGPSPAWVAVQGSQVIGFRTFMRWEFEDAGRVVRAVRAVDTATHPEHQGRGIFKRLTLHAVDELRDEGVEFIFNTPNDQSRPGYLKMGWKVVGRLPVAIRPRSLTSLPRLARSRTAAELVSVPTSAGYDFASLDADRFWHGHESTSRHLGLRTGRSQRFRLWRYGLAGLHYRAMVDRGGEEWAVFRLRRRGSALEATVCEASSQRNAFSSEIIGRVLRQTRAHYAIGLGTLPGLSLPVPGQGPLVTWLPLQDRDVAWSSASLTLGDIELF